MGTDTDCLVWTEFTDNSSDENEEEEEEES
jgi:hypothetical protein